MLETNMKLIRSKRKPSILYFFAFSTTASNYELCPSSCAPPRCPGSSCPIVGCRRHPGGCNSRGQPRRARRWDFRRSRRVVEHNILNDAKTHAVEPFDHLAILEHAIIRVHGIAAFRREEVHWVVAPVDAFFALYRSDRGLLLRAIGGKTLRSGVASQVVLSLVNAREVEAGQEVYGPEAHRRVPLGASGRRVTVGRRPSKFRDGRSHSHVIALKSRNVQFVDT